MSELFIIDWDDHQARVLIGSTRGGSLRVEQVATADIDGKPTAASIAEALRAQLADIQYVKANVVVVLGGRDVQSRLLRVPPVPADELPDLVRLRAGTEFPVVDEAAIVDFLPIESIDSTPSAVLATRITAKTLADAHEVCNKLHLAPEHIAMRGCGVAELAKASDTHPKQGLRLLIVRRNFELDLIGTLDANAAVARTVPLPEDADEKALALAAAREIRRTVAAMSSELGAQDVDAVSWIVGDELDQRIADHCSREFSRRIDAVEFSSLTSSDAIWPEGAAAFAGMVGTGVALAKKGLSVDFLSPRKPPEKATSPTTYVLAVALVALVFLGGGWMLYSNVASLERETARDVSQRELIEAEVESLAVERKFSQEVEQWLASDVNWLDEIERIATTLRPETLDNHDEFEPDRDVRLTSLVMKKAAGRRSVGGVVELAGGVRDDDVLEDLEQQLRGPDRQVNPKPLIKDDQAAPYVWTFQADIVVTPPQEDDR